MGAVAIRAGERDPVWGAIGGVGVLAWALVQGLSYWGSVRTRSGGSLQTIEWGHRKAEPRGLARLASVLEGFARTDVIATTYAVLILADQFELLLGLHCAASVAGALYFASQLPKLSR